VSQSVNTLLNTIYDMLTGSFYWDNSARVPGSGSAWQQITKFVTGSNTEAVYCFPPTRTIMSMSVILAGRALPGAGASSSAVAVTGSRETLISRGLLYGACVKGATSESFTQWTSQYPFGSSSISTGYVKIGASASVFGLYDTITIYESKEAIAFTLFDFQAPVSGNYPFFAGAIIDPEQGSLTSSLDAEQDGRLYGVATISGNGIGRNMHSPVEDLATDPNISGSLFDTVIDVPAAVGGFDVPKFNIFIPSSIFTMGAGAEKLGGTAGTTTAWVPGSQFTRMSGKYVAAPIKCVRKSRSNSLNPLVADPRYFLGRLRDVSMCKEEADGQVIKDEYVGQYFGFAISAHPSYQSQAVLLNYS
jgi:hypothetical protein